MVLRSLPWPFVRSPALSWIQGKAKIVQEHCLHCGQCQFHCPRRGRGARRMNQNERCAELIRALLQEQHLKDQIDILRISHAASGYCGA